MKNKFKIIGYISLALLIIIIIALSFYAPHLKQFSSPKAIRDLLVNSGNWGFILFNTLLLISTISPLPNTPIAFGGGYVYGTILGTIFALITTIIGGGIYFYLSRHLGLPIVKKIVDKHHILHFNKIFKKRGIWAVLISFAVPIFPSTTLCLLLGLTGVSFQTFLWITFLGHIPRFILLNSLGADLAAGFTLQTIFILIGTILMAIVAFFREPIKRYLFKEVRAVETEVEVVEEKLGFIHHKYRKSNKNNKRYSKKKEISKRSKRDE